MARRFQEITEVYRQEIAALARADRWTAFLRSACRNYKLPFEEQVLVHAQRPDATAVLEIERWNRQFGRWVNKGATGIAVFDRDYPGRTRLKYYFDISDTHESRLSRPVPLWQVPAEQEPNVIEALENRFGALDDKGTLEEAIVSAMENAAADNMTDYLDDLQNCRDNSLLEELDELNLSVLYRRLLENSTAYMLMCRCGLEPDEYFDPEDFSEVFNFNTPETLNALGVATRDIAESGLSAIALTVRSRQKQIRTIAQASGNEYPIDKQTETQTERSETHGTDIHDEGRLPAAGSAAAAGAGNSPWEIRPATPEVSEGAPEGAVHEPADIGQAERASGGDRPDGAAARGTDGDGDGSGRGRDGGAESRRPDEVGGADEQPEKRRRGDSAGGADLQLNTEPEEADSAEEATSELPAFLDEKKIFAIIENRNDELIYKKAQIELFFRSHPDEAERAEYLRSAYQDRFTEILADGARLGYRPQKNGLLMWEGAYLSRTSESVFSWKLVAGFTAQLIDKREYYVNTEIKPFVPMESQQLMGMLPDSMRDCKVYGVELDSISGRIARQLYQNSRIAVTGYEKAEIPDSFFDAAVGNVPFGNIKVVDRRYDKHHWLIHDYFLGKTLDKIRPGGVIAFITSKGTMDKESPAVRKYLAQRADLIGAIRLPNTAFKASAGTDVTSDILFLQKRDRIVDIEPDWVHLDTDENGIRMNSYFVRHPEMVLGEMAMESTQYGMDSVCKPYENADLADLLSEAVSGLHAQIPTYEQDGPEEEDLSIPADPNVRNYSFTSVDGKLYFRIDSRMEPVELPLTTENRVRGMIALRDCTRQLIEYQAENHPDEIIRREQEKLNGLYDAYVKKYGRLYTRGNNLAFSDDSSYPLLCSLEVLDNEGNFARKADMFTKRTIRPHEPVTQVDTASEALAVSLSEKAQVDLGFMSELSGKSEDELVQELSGVIYRNVRCGLTPEEISPVQLDLAAYPYVTAEEFLSGNVRKKLRMLQALQAALPAEKKQELAGYLSAMEAVQPTELTAAEIGVRIGASWVPTDVYQQFMFELFGTSVYARQRMRVVRSEYSGEWNISNKSMDGGNIKAVTTYGTKRITAYHILEQTLNQRVVKVFDTVVEDGKERPVLNVKETAIAQDRQELIKSKFADWLWQDIDRRERLCRIYNDTFNSIRPREYDGSHIRFVGMNPEISLRKHQVNAIAHVLYGGNALLAHEVGAGKTFEIVAAAMEMKRLGLCTKSLIVVPNHITEQWAAEWLQLYPAANILVATERDFEKRNRRRLCARIATGDYDAIIIGHSQLMKIPLSRERQQAILQRQIDEVLLAISDAKRQKAENFTIKQMERTRKSLEARLEKLNDQSTKDDTVTFEELGIDRLFIDESHSFKNLFLMTKMRNVGGIAQTEAQKSSDLFAKCQYLDELTDSHGVIFATGTPISNSMVELYTVQRYLQYQTLQEMGLIHFDDWASDYGETVTAIELSPEGSGYRPKTRFAKFFNLPELMATFKMVADVQTADMLKLPVPKANFHTEVIHPSELQKKAVAGLAERAERVRARVVDPSTDNMLRITNDGRKLALDMRLLSSLAPDDENSKVSVCARNVYRIWAESTAQRSTQLIFCDLSTPKADGSFNVYDDLRRKLLEIGIPENEIAYIHTANTEQKKKELFAKVRGGEVRILMGSTAKMGAGTNVQDRLIALHDLDCPWRPSDLQQRLGRIVRQGNQNPEVEIFRYVTEGTFDAYLYQLVESKQRFIAQIMTSKAPARAAEDVDETALSYAEIKALATGNPQIIEKCNLDMEVSKLNMLRASHLSQRYALEELVLRKYPAEIKELSERIAGYEQDSARLAEHPKPAEGIAPMVLNDVTYAERENAGKAIIEACTHMNGAETVSIGSYRGFSMLLSYDGAANEFRMVLKGKLSHTAVLGADAGGNVTRIDNALEKITEHLANARSQLAHTTEQLENARTEMTAPFPKEAELAEKTRRLNELNVLLNLNEQDRPVMADEPDEGDRIRPKNAERER